GLILEEGIQKRVKRQLDLFKFLDMTYANPLLLAFQKKLHDKMLVTLDEHFKEWPEHGEYWSQPGRNIKQTLAKIYEDGRKIGEEKGVSLNPGKQMNIITLGITAILFGLVGISFIFTELQSIMFYILIVGTCGMCIVPKMLRSKIISKIRAFIDENGGQFNLDHQDELQIIHDLAQYYLEDYRQILLENEINVEDFNFAIENTDYKNIKVVRTVRNPQTQALVNVVRFLKEGENPDEEELQNVAFKDTDVDFDVDESADEDLEDIPDED
ncbi:MAG: hypothetical protein ACTSVI_10495, partial [Promethearchaeota archaeon]